MSICMSAYVCICSGKGTHFLRDCIIYHHHLCNFLPFRLTLLAMMVIALLVITVKGDIRCLSCVLRECLLPAPSALIQFFVVLPFPFSSSHHHHTEKKSMSWGLLAGIKGKSKYRCVSYYYCLHSIDHCQLNEKAYLCGPNHATGIEKWVTLQHQVVACQTHILITCPSITQFMCVCVCLYSESNSLNCRRRRPVILLFHAEWYSSIIPLSLVLKPRRRHTCIVEPSFVTILRESAWWWPFISDLWHSEEGFFNIYYYYNTTTLMCRQDHTYNHATRSHFTKSKKKVFHQIYRQKVSKILWCTDSQVKLSATIPLNTKLGKQISC